MLTGKEKASLEESQAFEKELAELQRLQNQIKTDLLRKMEMPFQEIGVNDFKISVRDGKKWAFGQNRVSEETRIKTYEDYFGPKFHETYSFDFLKLKNIDGTLIAKGTKAPVTAEDAANPSSKVRFCLIEDKQCCSPIKEPSGIVNALKSCLKKKTNSLSVNNEQTICSKQPGDFMSDTVQVVPTSEYDALD